MARPITWQNVTINDGSGSASLGNTAAGFGRNAIQGLDIFSEQMQDRINREDTLLTNDAIAAALSGGPAVSNNRRVDANALQLAVERGRTGTRLQEAHQDDLLTSGVAREGQKLQNVGQGFLNQQNEFKVQNQQAVFDTEQKAAEAEAEFKRAQTKEALLRMQETRRAVVEARRAADAENAITEYYAVGQEDEFRKRFDEEAKNIKGWDELTSDEQAAMYRQRRDNVYVPEVESDPYRGVKVAKQLGYKPSEYYKSSIGQEDLAAQRLVQEKQAEKLLAQEEVQTAIIEEADKVARTGEFKNAVPDTSVEGGFTFVKDAQQVTAGGAAAYGRSLGLDMDAQDAKDLVQTVMAAFPAEAAFRTMLAKEVDEDGDVIEGAEDRIFADQQRVRLLAEEVVRKSNTAPTLGNASGDLQTAVSATLQRRNGGGQNSANGTGAGGTEGEFKVPVTEKHQKVNATLADLNVPALEVHEEKNSAEIVREIEQLARDYELKQRQQQGLTGSTSGGAADRARLALIRAIEQAERPPYVNPTPYVAIQIQPK